MKDASGQVLYIGKAKNLRKRVASYFSRKDHEPKTLELVKAVYDVDFLVTENEVEALVLEAQLIRSYQPSYNIDLKDSVRYAYLKLTSERFPRLVAVRKILSKRKEKYFGPYPFGYARSLVERLSSRIFKLRVCKKLPRKACLLYSLGQCTAPCIGRVSQEEYAEQIRQAEMFLLGKTQKLLQTLELEMRRFAGEQMFEKAQELKEQIQALQHIWQPQRVDLPKWYDQDVLNGLSVGGELFVQVFHISRGVIAGKDEFKVQDGLEAFESLVKQYYFTHSLPREVILPNRVSEPELLQEYFSRLKQQPVLITLAQRGYKKDLLEMVLKNIELKLASAPIRELKQVLGLEQEPKTIDCFDISTLAGKFSVGSCVRFTDGKPNKKGYRHFKIKTIKDINDFAMITEVVRRRYAKALAGDYPDLLMIDGGLGQLHAAGEALHEFGLTFPLISLAKKFEEVYTGNKLKPLRLPQSAYSLKLLQYIRNEAHRFAITYHRKLRSKGLVNIH